MKTRVLMPSGGSGVRWQSVAPTALSEGRGAPGWAGVRGSNAPAASLRSGQSGVGATLCRRTPKDSLRSGFLLRVVFGPEFGGGLGGFVIHVGCLVAEFFERGMLAQLFERTRVLGKDELFEFRAAH